MPQSKQQYLSMIAYFPEFDQVDLPRLVLIQELQVSDGKQLVRCDDVMVLIGREPDDVTALRGQPG